MEADARQRQAAPEVALNFKQTNQLRRGVYHGNIPTSLLRPSGDKPKPTTSNVILPVLDTVSEAYCWYSRLPPGNPLSLRGDERQIPHSAPPTSGKLPSPPTPRPPQPPLINAGPHRPSTQSPHGGGHHIVPAHQSPSETPKCLLAVITRFSVVEF